MCCTVGICELRNAKREKYAGGKSGFLFLLWGFVARPFHLQRGADRRSFDGQFFTTCVMAEVTWHTISKIQTCTEVFVQAVRVSNRSFAYKRSTHTSLTGTGKRYLLREEYTHTPWQAAATCFLYFGVLPRKSVSATLPKIFVIIGEHARFALNRSVVIVLPSKTLQPTCGFKWSYFATILVFAPISNGHEDHDDTIAKWNLLVCHVKLNSTFCTASSIPDDNKIRF